MAFKPLSVPNIERLKRGLPDKDPWDAVGQGLVSFGSRFNQGMEQARKEALLAQRDREQQEDHLARMDRSLANQKDLVGYQEGLIRGRPLSKLQEASSRAKRFGAMGTVEHPDTGEVVPTIEGQEADIRRRAGESSLTAAEDERKKAQVGAETQSAYFQTFADELRALTPDGKRFIAHAERVVIEKLRAYLETGDDVPQAELNVTKDWLKERVRKANADGADWAREQREYGLKLHGLKASAKSGSKRADKELSQALKKNEADSKRAISTLTAMSKDIDKNKPLLNLLGKGGLPQEKRQMAHNATAGQLKALAEQISAVGYDTAWVGTKITPSNMPQFAVFAKDDAVGKRYGAKIAGVFGQTKLVFGNLHSRIYGADSTKVADLWESPEVTNEYISILMALQLPSNLIEKEAKRRWSKMSDGRTTYQTPVDTGLTGMLDSNWLKGQAQAKERSSGQ